VFTNIILLHSDRTQYFKAGVGVTRGYRLDADDAVIMVIGETKQFR
jgi:hypothetical protein